MSTSFDYRRSVIPSWTCFSVFIQWSHSYFIQPKILDLHTMVYVDWEHMTSNLPCPFARSQVNHGKVVNAVSECRGISGFLKKTGLLRQISIAVSMLLWALDSFCKSNRFMPRSELSTKWSHKLTVTSLVGRSTRVLLYEINTIVCG